MLQASKPRKIKYQPQKKWSVLINFNDYDLEGFKTLVNFSPKPKAVVLHKTPQLIPELIESELHIIDGGDFNKLTDLDEESWSAIILGTKLDLSNLETLSLTRLRPKRIALHNICDAWESLW